MKTNKESVSVAQMSSSTNISEDLFILV